MKRSTSIALVCLTLTGACSKVKELDNRTKSMERATSDMSGTTSEMKDTVAITYQHIRSKEAEATRSTSMKAIKSEESDMGEKFYAACVYFQSFEFQLWNDNDSYDTSNAREVMFKNAANELVKRLDGIYKEIDVEKMSPSKEGKRHNAEMAFYALAAAMHFVHPYQDDLAAHNADFKTVSFYDLIKESLVKDLNGDYRLEHNNILNEGINKEIMIELIKARVDILSALVLKDLTDKRKMNFGQKMEGLLFKVSGGKLGAINLPETYDKANEATKMTVETRLDAAIKARNFLREIGVSKTVEKTIKSGLDHIDFNEKPSDASKAEDKRKTQLRRLINTLLE